jgi:hypothetical protein
VTDLRTTETGPEEPAGGVVIRARVLPGRIATARALPLKPVTATRRADTGPMPDASISGSGRITAVAAAGPTHEINAISAQGIVSGKELRRRPRPIHLRLENQPWLLLES